MRHLNGTLSLRGQTPHASEAHKSVKTSAENLKKVRVLSQSTVSTDALRVSEVVEMVDAQIGYQERLVENIAGDNAPDSLFKAVRSAWNERVDNIP